MDPRSRSHAQNLGLQEEEAGRHEQRVGGDLRKVHALRFFGAGVELTPSALGPAVYSRVWE